MNETPRFSEEDMKVLYKAEIHFNSVLKSSTLKGAPACLTKEIAKIYEKTFNKHLNKNYNCQVCAFSIYRIVGKAYFDQLNSQKKNIDQLNNQLNTETQQIENKDDKKSTIEVETKPTKKSKQNKNA